MLIHMGLADLLARTADENMAAALVQEGITLDNIDTEVDEFDPEPDPHHRGGNEQVARGLVTFET